MIFVYGDRFDDPGQFIALTGALVAALVIGIAFHEFCHAFMADSLGDPLPASQGRVTLNPLAHLDPWGTALLLLGGFGWGKPVQHNPFASRLSPRTTSLLVAAAGPLSNFVVAGLLAVPLKVGWVDLPGSTDAIFDEGFSSGAYLGLFLLTTVYLNVILGIFNLIPLPPLDGFHVALGILPDWISQELGKLQQYGFGILLVVLFVVPFVIGYSPLREIMVPASSWLVDLFVGA